MVDAHEQVERFQEFFDANYKKQIHEIVSKGAKSLVVDFLELSRFDPEIADLLLEEPEEIMKAAELAVEQFEVKELIRVRFKNLPKGQHMMLKDIRSKHINKLLYFEAIVRQSSDIRPQVVCAKFECPACGSVITILQVETKFKEPLRCTCGRKGKFRLLSKDLVDAQRLVVEEAPEDLEGGAQPKRMSVFLKEDLVEPKMEKKTTPGSKIGVTGIVREIPIILKSGVASTRYDLMIEANYLEPIQEEFTEIELNPEDVEEIKNLASDPRIYERLINSIAPSIWGHEKIKEALILQLIGGVRKKKKDGTVTRGDMHILLVGDPGSGKCVFGGTKIVLDDGSILPIKDFVDKQGIFELQDGGFKSTSSFSIPALDKDGSMGFKQSNVVWKRKSPDTMLKIRTGTGNELIITKNHPLFTTYYGLIFANESRNFSVGDYIATPRFINVNSKLQSLPLDFKRSKSKVKKIISVPSYLGVGTARLLAYIIGESYIDKKKYTLMFTNDSTVLIKDFCYLLSKFSLKSSVYNCHNKVFVKRCYCTSVDFISFLQAVEPSLLLHSKYKKIPLIICKSPNNVLKEFIKALFDCEGYIQKGKRQIDISSASKDLIYDLKLLLLRFGIISQVSMKMKCTTNTIAKTKRPYYELRISGKDAVKYIREIGFNHTDKKLKAQKLLNLSKGFNTNLDIIPYLAPLLKDLRKESGLRQRDINIPQPSYRHYERGDRFVSREQLKKIINSYKQETSLLLILKQIVDSDIFWDKIVSIEEVPSESEFVYDLQVEETHNYIANSVIVHNSQMLQFISKAAPKARYVAGRSTSGAGITASVVRDEFLRGWALEAGAMVLANKGILCLDEMDKMAREDTDALHEAMEQQQVTITKANIQACYSSDTEVLTEDGWKNYLDVKSLKISQFNPSTKTIMFLPHRGLFVYNHKGKMYHFVNKRNDILVTPNHKMLAKEYSQKSYSIIEAENLNYCLVRFINSANFVNREQKYFTLPPINHKQNRTHEKYVHQHKSKKIPMDLWLEFLGYFLTEGGLQRNPAIGIPQKDKSNVRKIRTCLSALSKCVGFTLSESKENQYTRFQIANTQLFDFLEKNCGRKCSEKKFPFKLSSFSKRQLTILYDAMMLGDGSSSGKDFSSVSKDLINIFQALACLVGKSASKHTVYEAGYRGNRQTLYRVSLSDRTEPSIKREKIKQVDYKGKVFCFSTLTGFFVTRRNGKIAIQGNTLRSETTVLAAANPKLGRFDPYRLVAEQIDLPPALINRFDLIFPIRDMPDKIKDERIATHVLDMHHSPENIEPEIPIVLLRKYISYVKQNIFPKIGEDAMDEIKKFYVGLRNSENPSEKDTKRKPIPITPRQLEALIRLAEGSARVRLDSKIKRQDAKRAIELLKYCLMQVGIDPETGQIDIDVLSTGISTSTKNKMFLVRDIISSLEEKAGDKLVPITEVIKEAETKGLDESTVMQVIDRLNREGEIFKPKEGFVKKI